MSTEACFTNIVLLNVFGDLATRILFGYRLITHLSLHMTANYLTLAFYVKTGMSMSENQL